MSSSHVSFRQVLLAVALPCFAAGLAAMQLFVHRDALLALTFESYEARYEAMTSATSGPQRYYVLHEPETPLREALVAVLPEQFSASIFHACSFCVDILGRKSTW